MPLYYLLKYFTDYADNYNLTNSHILRAGYAFFVRVFL